MIFKKTFIKDLIVIKPKVFFDERGLFFESYNKKLFDFNTDFVQDNESESKKGVIRGLHFQNPPFEQTKLVRCVKGNILDVVVDIRTNSKTYGSYFSIELSSENKKQIYIPKGFAHGFQVLSKKAIVSYKVDSFYNPSSDNGIIWNDTDLEINWKKGLKKIISKKDQDLPSFKFCNSPFK
jgi:dTDP-4-dehydrorhamnose 3,5-epimerase